MKRQSKIKSETWNYTNANYTMQRWQHIPWTSARGQWRNHNKRENSNASCTELCQIPRHHIWMQQCNANQKWKRDMKIQKCKQYNAQPTTHPLTKCKRSRWRAHKKSQCKSCVKFHDTTFELCKQQKHDSDKSLHPGQHWIISEGIFTTCHMQMCQDHEDWNCIAAPLMMTSF